MQLLYESLKSNPTALLYCIQYEVLDKRPVFDSYRSFCRKMGPDVMDFATFEFWYMRFYRDQLDMKFERDEKPLELLDLPVELVDKVVEELDPVDRIVTRQVCKTLQRFVDGQCCSIKNITFQLSHDHASLGFDGEKTLYKNIENGCKVEFEGSEFVVENEHFVKTAMKDFNAILNTQKRKLENLHLSMLIWTPEDLVVLNSESQNTEEIHVRNLTVEGCWSSAIWSLLVPGVLENIKLTEYSGGAIPNVLVETEQWKQARFIDMDNCGAVMSRELSKLYATRNIRLSVVGFQMNDLVQLGVNLRQSHRFEKCSFTCNQGFTNAELAVALGAVFQYNGTIRDPIPDTNDYIEYTSNGRRVTIVRKSG